MCLGRSQMEWAWRLEQEDRISKSAYFLTLTYDNLFLRLEKTGTYPEVRKDDVQRYIKRLRQLNHKMVLEH